ncbi:DUF4145 domain-containing protein [Polaromonas glacialis]|uniref:DUF4145 domain-containing protein n=1 Tax=Polaromonas glacialis TaxID=866564 RepID=UPI000497AB33|nr:DUF4145 domain-containing protein [Polaromonas glacialis]
MANFNWNCPHCERAVTITDERLSNDRHTLGIENAEGRRSFVSRFFVCPNPDCKRFTLTATLCESTWQNGGERVGTAIQHWNLIPDSRAKNFPDYIPKAILDDYREACLIRDLSPKASATLSRRCLQGMIRDFWKVKPGRLVDEISAIQPHVDPLTWDAIEAVRKIGNIGAHMERDIDIIVDVDPNEANLLIELIETLMREWYINREERRARMGHLVAAAAAKKPPSQ